jgi:hypothetical protein
MAGNELNRSTSRDARVIVADDGDPMAIYYKRWRFLQNGLWSGKPIDSRYHGHSVRKAEKRRSHALGFTKCTR